MKPITVDRFDDITNPRSSGRKIWGAPMIAQNLGVSEDSVRRLARDPACPIYKPGGRYFAYRAELEAWLRTKPR